MRTSHCAPCILYDADKHRCLECGRYIKYMSGCAADQIKRKVENSETAEQQACLSQEKAE